MPAIDRPLSDCWSGAYISARAAATSELCIDDELKWRAVEVRRYTSIRSKTTAWVTTTTIPIHAILLIVIDQGMALGFFHD